MKEMAREGCLGYVVVSLKNENRAVEMGGGGVLLVYPPPSPGI